MADTPDKFDQTADRRAQLLIASRQVMGDFGVRRTTVGDVAKAAGVSRQTVYEYFPTREALIEETLKRGAARLVQAGADAAQDPSRSPEERLAVLLEVSIAFFRSSQLWATKGKRADLVTHVALEDGVFLGAGVAALDDALTAWWPEADAGLLARAADTLARTLVSHGLSPSDEAPEVLARQLARLVARGLD